jgi:hypothetical protein
LTAVPRFDATSFTATDFFALDFAAFFVAFAMVSSLVRARCGPLVWLQTV